MGIFNINDKQTKAGTTVISDGTFIRGGIDTTGAIFCDGKFEGGINSDSLTIGKTGEVIGNIKVETLVISGIIDGIINANEVHILENVKIIGKMQYETLTIDKNGIFEGEGKMKNSNLVSKYKNIDEPFLEEPVIQELIQE
jgi:cytoskeletal protein CcmA (bactofilin family)